MTGAQFVEVMLQPKLDKLQRRWTRVRCRRPRHEEWAGDGTPAGHAAARQRAGTTHYEAAHQVAQELYAILATSQSLVIRAPVRALLTFRECATLDIAAGTEKSDNMAKAALATAEVLLDWLCDQGELGSEEAEDPGGPDAAAGLGLQPD